MPSHCIIIGGGFAGLSAAAHLSNSGFKITLLEASPKLGGRAYSFFDEQSASVIDNGQHILMGCYNYTLEFLRLTGAIKNFFIQKNLEVKFIKPGFQKYELKALPFFYPFNLLFGLLNFKAIPLKSRQKILYLILKLPFINIKKVNNKSVIEWLNSEKQDADAVKAFWEILCVGALNTSVEKASAIIFISILKEIFLNGNNSSKIILPENGLSESYCNDSSDFILSKNGIIKCGEQVEKLIIRESKAVKVVTDKNEYTGFDFVISAVPHFAFKRFTVENILSSIPQFNYSTIVNIFLWLKQNNLTEKFYGLIDSPVHWVFNKGDHINLVISNADYLKENSAEEIFAMIKIELEKFLLISPDQITNFKAIKEKRATFVPDNNSLNNRPFVNTSVQNLFVAGDWVDTGLPSTIESAVKSGKLAAEAVEKQSKSSL